jgi:DNA-binding NarL/FixJ family response regulator
MPDLLLLDVELAGKNTVALVPEIKRLAADTPVLRYCTTAKNGDILAAMRAGAEGFLEKTCSRNDFLDAVDRLTKGDNYLCARSINVLATSLRGSAVLESKDGAPNSQLTVREKQILTLVASGDSSKEIAKKLFLSVSTVETHRANLMTKIRARNVAQLIQYGFQHGLVDFGRTPAA